MDLAYWKTVFKTLNFNLFLQACPFSPQFSLHAGLPHLKIQVTKNFQGARKNNQILSFFTNPAQSDRDTGEWHIDGGALSVYSQVLV